MPHLGQDGVEGAHQGVVVVHFDEPHAVRVARGILPGALDGDGGVPAPVHDDRRARHHRGGGLAKRIVAELLDFAAHEDIQELALEYALHNPEAEAFWGRLGFQSTGVRASAQVSDVRTRLRSEAQRKAEEET